MDVKEIISGMVLLILVFLLVNNGDKTNTVIKSLSSGLDNTISVLQGRTASGA